MATFPTNPAADALDGSEIVPVTQGGVDKKTTTQDIADLAGGLSNPMTTAEDMIVGGASGVPTRQGFSANKFPARASTGGMVAKDITDFGLSLVDDADASAARATLGLGTAATTAASTYATAAQGATADSATQPGDLAAIATSGDVGDLTGFPGGSTNFLREDGTFAAPPGGSGMTNPMTTAGDIIVGGASGAPARLAKGSDGQVLRMASGVQAYGFPLQCIAVAISDEVTNLTTGTAKATIHMPYAFTLVDVKAGVTVAQTAGSILTFDINEAGVSVLSTKLTIDNSEKTSGTAATPPVIFDASLANNAEVTFDIDQVGTALAKGAKIYLIGYPTP
jgi:hypothetical protein